MGCGQSGPPPAHVVGDDDSALTILHEVANGQESRRFGVQSIVFRDGTEVTTSVSVFMLCWSVLLRGDLKGSQSE